MKKMTVAAVVAALMCATSAFATTMSFDVHANNHVWDDGTGHNGNLGLATGITLAAGDTFTADVATAGDTWNFCTSGSVSSCEVNADGVRPASNSILGAYSSAGFSFAYGALVGRIGSGDFFQIGTAGFDGPANASGELFLFHWDHNTNNGGSILVNVSVAPSQIPLPAGLPLIAGGLAAFGFIGARKRRKN